MNRVKREEELWPALEVVHQGGNTFGIVETRPPNDYATSTVSVADRDALVARFGEWVDKVIGS